MDRTEKLFMPLWQPFTGIRAETMIGSLSDEEERTVALAAHHYFQAKYEDAARESQRFLNSPCPEIRATALLLHGMANVGLGNAELVREDFAALKRSARQPEDEKMAAVYDALRFLLAVFFHTAGELPAPEDDHAQRLTLWQAVLSLNDDLRAPVTLFYYDGLSIREISRVLGISEAAVKTRLSRGRARLRQLLDEK